MSVPPSAYLDKRFLSHTQGNIVIVQHTGGWLDDVLGCLASTGEAIVLTHGKILVTTRAILQFKYLAWNY